MPTDPPLEYTQFDTDPPLEEDLQERNPDTGVWGPMDLAGKTVRLLAENARTKHRFGGTATVVDVSALPDPKPSRVRYTPVSSDLRDEGTYRYQWEVSTAAGARRTVPPGDDWRELEVRRKLGAAA